MAVVAVSFDGTRLSTADAVTSFVAESATPTNETDYFYQGTASVSAQVKTTETGFYYNPAATNFSSPERVWISKFIVTNPGSLDGNGILVRVGSATTAYHQYNLFTATTYPNTGGWQILPINPNVVAHRTSTTGAPSLAAVTYLALRADCGATSKAPNLGMDAVDYITSGTGLTLVGGDGVSTDGTFADFVTFDEGTAGNRYGIIQTRSGIIFCNAVMTIGSATATGFTDSNGVVVFPSHRHNTGGCGINFGLQSASSVISVSDYVFTGRGIDGGTYDSRPNYNVTGTSGSLTLTACTLNVFRTIVLTSTTTLNGCSILNGLSLTQNGATLTDCTIASATTTTGTAFITSDNPTLISGCAFTHSTGHAIMLTVPGTYAFAGNQFDSYGAAGTNEAAIYNNSGGAITLNITGGGSTPTVRNGAGASTTVNANVSITLTGLKNPTEVRVYTAGTTTAIAGQESITTGSFVFAVGAGVAVDISILALGFQNMRLLNFSTTADTSVPISQVIDRQYQNT